jgi:hypothetical protein
MRRHIHALIRTLGINFPELPYCPQCGGHYPPHSH